jgi:flagellin
MASYLNTNMASLNAQRNLSTSQGALGTSIQRLSSGLRINSAKDDAAGLAISNRMDAQIRGQVVAQRNANDAISISQTAEGALGKVADSLQRMRELATQASNGTNATEDLDNLNEEYSQLSDEITRVLANTKFNDHTLIGANAADVAIQVGAKSTDQITIALTDMGAANGELDKVLNTDAIDTQANASVAMTDIDAALTVINTQRSKMGAVQNRFQSVVENLQTSTENTQAARSRIVDADYASETAVLARNQILQQAGMAMLSQANQLPNGIMSLLR